MIARRLERCRQIRKETLALVMHFAHFAMNNLMAPHDRAAKGLPNGLMPQTDTHERNAGRSCGLCQGQTDARLRWITGAR